MALHVRKAPHPHKTPKLLVYQSTSEFVDSLNLYWHTYQWVRIHAEGVDSTWMVSNIENPLSNHGQIVTPHFQICKHQQVRKGTC